MTQRFRRKTLREFVASPWRNRHRPKLKGLLEGSINGAVEGWVFDPASPLSRLSVQITPAEARSVTVMADRYRADLQAAGIGDGYYGFSINAARLSKSNHLTARVMSHDFDLPQTNPRARSDDHRVGDAGRYKYRIDPQHFPGSRLNGWVVNTSDSLERCRVALIVANKICFETIACRRDLDVPGPFDSYHGFVVNRPIHTKRGLSVSVVEANGSLSVLTTLS